PDNNLPPAATVTTNTPPSFLWSQIESADYSQYVANLRAIGCPEQIIRDIIICDLNQLFAPRAQAIWKRSVHEYWQRNENTQPSPKESEQLYALEREKAAVFKELLGVS